VEVPAHPKIYHIVPVDRLTSIIDSGRLWSNEVLADLGIAETGTSIGMSEIKQRRRRFDLKSRPGLCVGDCVPFYFCPRSVMLRVIYFGNNPDLDYRGGQGPIVHLEADLHQTVAWANKNGWRWAFTTSNAGSYRFKDYADLTHLAKIDWDAVQSNQWEGDDTLKEGKQAEFLIAQSFPWKLVCRIGVRSCWIRNRVLKALQATDHNPAVEIKPSWYY